MRLATVLTVLILLAGNIGTSDARASEGKMKCPTLISTIVKNRAATWEFQEQMQVVKTRTAYHERHTTSCGYLWWLRNLWKERRVEARKAAQRHFRALYDKWRCIHLHEGAWNSNTGNGYYGGLQMDMGFQRTYGGEFMARWGTANNWPVWAQLVAAERAFHGYHGYGGRGFGPWPNTSRMCGVY